MLGLLKRVRTFGVDLICLRIKNVNNTSEGIEIQNDLTWVH